MINGRQVADEQCQRLPRPAATRTAERYDGCGYEYRPGEWGDYGSTCDQAATRSRSVVCHRSDGVDLDAAECPASAGQAPAATDAPTTVLSGCGYT